MNEWEPRDSNLDYLHRTILINPRKRHHAYRRFISQPRSTAPKHTLTTKHPSPTSASFRALRARSAGATKAAAYHVVCSLASATKDWSFLQLEVPYHTSESRCHVQVACQFQLARSCELLSQSLWLTHHKAYLLITICQVSWFEKPRATISCSFRSRSSTQ